jgi:NAD(P)-dependent dehydrogenase (short-subunit alcohol dehydrogenase family)
LAEGGGVGKIAIITGGASGIGLALGRALVRRRAEVVLADVNGEGVARAAHTLTAEGPGTAEGVELDVADAAAVNEVVQGTHGRHGRLDLLFNNAGIGVGGEPEELSLAHWERAIDVNLRGVLHGCHAAYPLMKEQGFGHIVNTASLAGLGPGLGTTGPYNTTKYAVVGLSLSLRGAGADAGVRVSVVCPGLIDTPILDRTDVPGLPTPPSVAGVDVRSFMHKTGMKRSYPPERLAEDVLAGLAKNRPIIVAPREARMAWLALRLSPRLADKLGTKMTRTWREHAAAVRAAP